MSRVVDVTIKSRDETAAGFSSAKRSVQVLEIEARKMNEAFDAEKAKGFFGKLNDGAASAGKAVSLLKTAFIGMAVWRVASDVIGLGDAYTNLRSRLGLVTTDTDGLNRVQAQLFATSQLTRTEMEANVSLYTSLARSTKTLGLSEQDLQTITATTAKSFLVSGASASETSAAVRQLGQAFASGVLRGDEFNSIAENAPRLQQAVAASLGVTIGQLRAMAAEGKITSAVLAHALLKESKAIDAEFTRMPVTVAGAMTQIRNAVLMSVGATNEAQGSTAGMATALSSMAEAIPGIASVLNSFFGGIQLMAADAGIAVEKLSGTVGRFLKDHPKLRAATSNALREALPAVGPLIADRLDGAAAGAGDSEDTVRLLEKRRDELVARLTGTAGGAGLPSTGSAGGRAPGDGGKAHKAYLKALKEEVAELVEGAKMGTLHLEDLRKYIELQQQLEEAMKTGALVDRNAAADAAKRLRDADPLARTIPDVASTRDTPKNPKMANIGAGNIGVKRAPLSDSLAADDSAGNNIAQGFKRATDAITEARVSIADLSNDIGQTLRGSVDGLATAWGDAFEAMGSGSEALGTVMIREGRRAIAGVVSAKGSETLLDASKAFAEGFSNPIMFGVAAKLFAIGAGYKALAGALGGGGGSSASSSGGGLSGAGFSQSTAATRDMGKVTLFWPKGRKNILDINDPDDRDNVKEMFSKLFANRDIDVIQPD